MLQITSNQSESKWNVVTYCGTFVFLCWRTDRLGFLEVSQACREWWVLMDVATASGPKLE